MTAAPTSYVCPCGAGHPFAAWVYAHLDGELEHACPECGRVNLLIHGVLDQRMNGARVPDLWSATHAPDAAGVWRPRVSGDKGKVSDLPRVTVPVVKKEAGI